MKNTSLNNPKGNMYLMGGKTLDQCIDDCTKAKPGWVCHSISYLPDERGCMLHDAKDGVDGAKVVRTPRYDYYEKNCGESKE